MEGDGGEWMEDAGAVAANRAQPEEPEPAQPEPAAAVRRRAFARRAQFIRLFE